jgi:phosphoglycerate kinase
VKRLAELRMQGKRVLVRVDFNVPLDDGGAITSDKRIREALATIRAIRAAGGKPILMSHLGRPKGKPDARYSMRPVAVRLGELLGAPVRCASDCVGAAAKAAVGALGERECLVLENLRFHAGEEKGDAAFARALAELGDVYVNDAFGAAHRAHASVTGVPALLPHAPGLLLEKELAAFARVLGEPRRPLLAILGGAKVSDKLPVIVNLLERVDALIVGGAMAYTFLAEQGVPIGRSLCERDLVAKAAEVRARARAREVPLLLAQDHVCAAECAAGVPTTVHGPGVPEGAMALDIGPRTIEAFRAPIASAGTIVWNGPMGVFEIPEFRAGTEAIARAVAAAKGFSLVGGGDSVAAVEQLGVADRIDHVSTGGGAGLELLEGRILPGVAALEAD